MSVKFENRLPQPTFCPKHVTNLNTFKTLSLEKLFCSLLFFGAKLGHK